MHPAQHPLLQYLYVYQIREDGCHVAFDFDSVNEETVDTFGWLLSRYEPVFDGSGKCVCYVGVDLSMQGVRDYVVGYISRVAIIAVLFLTGCILIGMRLYIGTRRADRTDVHIAQQARDKQLTREIIEAFAKVVDLKDSSTQGHSSRVAHYTEMLAREMGCDDQTVENYYNIPAPD